MLALFYMRAPDKMQKICYLVFVRRSPAGQLLAHAALRAHPGPSSLRRALSVARSMVLLLVDDEAQRGARGGQGRHDHLQVLLRLKTGSGWQLATGLSRPDAAIVFLEFRTRRREGKQNVHEYDERVRGRNKGSCGSL